MQTQSYAEKIWKQLIDELLTTKKITTTSYDNWFIHTNAQAMDSKSITIQTVDEFTKHWLIDNYTDLLEKTLAELLGQKLSVFFIEENEKEETHFLINKEIKNEISAPIYSQNNIFQNQKEPQKETFEKQNNTPQIQAYDFNLTKLNPKLTFENFVSGSSNQLAYNIAIAISENPGSTYNPMFLYGGSGLGKTHLVQAIGNRIYQTMPHKKVLYVTSETFLSEYVTSIRTEKTSEFRERYRQIDVLIIDDIQFFVGKEGIQEEFFHTFNHLHQFNKQIIITSDSQPNELATLTERLRSRFSWGILTDIQPPELETRMAILYKKIDSLGSHEDVSEDVIEYIASNINSNVRDLEGALNSLFAHAIMLGKIDITLDLAVESLRSYTKKDTKNVSITRIQKNVAKYFQITVDDLKSKSRKQPILSYRHIAIYLCKNLTENSLQKIGSQFGNRDHTTVMNSIKKIDKQLKYDKDLRAVIDELLLQLK